MRWKHFSFVLRHSSFFRHSCFVIRHSLSSWGLLKPQIHRRRSAGADARIGVAEYGEVGFAVAVEIADIDAVLVMDAVFELDALHAVLRQAILAAEQDQNLVGLAMRDDQVVDAVAVPV